MHLKPENLRKVVQVVLFMITDTQLLQFFVVYTTHGMELRRGTDIQSGCVADKARRGTHNIA